MDNHKEIYSILLTFGILLATLYVVHRFIPSLAWATIISTSTYPLYQRWRMGFGQHHSLAALSYTLFLALVLILPLSWFLTLLFKEIQIFITYIQTLNQHGGPPPDFLLTFPWHQEELIGLWNTYLGRPGHVLQTLSNINISLASLSGYVKQLGINIAHRSIQTGFTLLTLFFFFRDGQIIYEQANRIGSYCLGLRWNRYFESLPTALRGTVNGTILVGLGVGGCMGICYALLGFPTPTLTGFLTAFASMIPFVVPVVFVFVALLFVLAGKYIAAMIVLGWGTFVMFVADHFIKPVLIGGAIELPFLAVLFGILGGLETMGLIGLFVGPIILVLFVTLCQELQNPFIEQEIKHHA